MIEIKLGQLRNPSFTQAYHKLMNTSGLQPKAAYHVARVGALLEQELKTANEAHDVLVKKWAEFKNENGQSFWKVPEDKLEGWTKENEEFHQATATVDKRKIMLAEIDSAALTPAEYLALEPVLGGLEMLEGGI